MNNRTRSAIWPAVIAVISLAAPQLARADGAHEFKVAGRTLGFIEGSASGTVTVAIVFDPSKPASVSEKDEVMAAIGSGMTVGSLTIVGRAVGAGSVAAQGDIAAIYMTHGVNYAAVGAAAKSKKILSISSDMACVNAGACVMGVTATPSVEIVVNKSTASASGIAFKSAFKMMIKEI